MLEAISANPDYVDAHYNLAVIYATNKPPAKELAKPTKAVMTPAPMGTARDDFDMRRPGVGRSGNRSSPA